MIDRKNDQYNTYVLLRVYLNQKHTDCKKEQSRTKKGLEVKSKWAAKACVVLLLMEIKF